MIWLLPTSLIMYPFGHSALVTLAFFQLSNMLSFPSSTPCMSYLEFCVPRPIHGWPQFSVTASGKARLDTLNLPHSHSRPLPYFILEVGLAFTEVVAFGLGFTAREFTRQQMRERCILRGEKSLRPKQEGVKKLSMIRSSE